jgi:hypothetical protein
MVSCLRGSMGTGTKEDDGRVWAAGFHHVRALSRLAGVLKLMDRLFPLIRESACILHFFSPTYFKIYKRHLT